MTFFPLITISWDGRGAKLQRAYNTNQFQSQGIGIYILQTSPNGIGFFFTVSVSRVMHAFWFRCEKAEYDPMEVVEIYNRYEEQRKIIGSSTSQVWSLVVFHKSS